MKTPDMEASYGDVVRNVPDFTRDVLSLYVGGALQGGCMKRGPEQPMCALQAKCARCGSGREFSWY